MKNRYLNKVKNALKGVWKDINNPEPYTSNSLCCGFETSSEGNEILLKNRRAIRMHDNNKNLKK